ncbi:chorismate mutase aro7 [Coelomomyces lativittatus]|nr:chorismate mutase aro7 [Coelomomyces lativittatus]
MYFIIFILFFSETLNILKLSLNCSFILNRSEYFANKGIYKPNAETAIDDFHSSILGNVLGELERNREKFKNFTSPEEHFFLQTSVVDSSESPNFQSSLFPNNININSLILAKYIQAILPLLVSCGDEPCQYYSTILADIEILRLLSKRIHLGKFVADIKFRQEKAKYVPLIKNRDSNSIFRTLTNSHVEESILERVSKKVEILNQLKGFKF